LTLATDVRVAAWIDKVVDSHSVRGFTGDTDALRDFMVNYFSIVKAWTTCSRNRCDGVYQQGVVVNSIIRKNFPKPTRGFLSWARSLLLCRNRCSETTYKIDGEAGEALIILTT
jgi:hypothetical protein